MNNETQEVEVWKKIHELDYTKNQFTQFYERWDEKCKDYTNARLSDYYDLFFSRFVIYNALYNVIVRTRERTGELKPHKQKGD